MQSANPSEVLYARACEDLCNAEILAADARSSDEGIGFFLQQAAEKALKAVLSHQGVEYPFTHDLGRLIALLGRSGVVVPAAFDTVRDWSPFAGAWRYGDRRLSRRRRFAGRKNWTWRAD